MEKNEDINISEVIGVKYEEPTRGSDLLLQHAMLNVLPVQEAWQMVEQRMN